MCVCVCVWTTNTATRKGNNTGLLANEKTNVGSCRQLYALMIWKNVYVFIKWKLNQDLLKTEVAYFLLSTDYVSVSLYGNEDCLR